MRKRSYALAHAHSLVFEIRFKKNKKGPKERSVDLLGKLYVETMKTKATKKSKSAQEDRSEIPLIVRAGVG